MPVLSFSDYRPDVSDYQGQHSRNISNVLPQGDGYGPFPSLNKFSSALNGACRGLFYARKSDGSILIFAATSNRLFTLNNTTFGWTPVSKVQTCTISNASPAVVTLSSHGLIAGDPVQFTTTSALPTGLSTGTTYYVISAGLTSGAFEVSATLGGSAINTTGAGSGTHSVTGTYSALSSADQWQFVQFNNFIISVQKNVAPQVYDLTSSTAFADLGGSPPQASYIAVVNRFVVLCGLASPNVYRLQWSGLNATTTWTSGVSQSDFQDLADGGIVRGVAGGEFGVIFQDQSIRRLTYAPGSPYVFSIDRISMDDGLLAPYSAINAGDRVFFLSPQGFKMIVPGGYPTPIGKEKVDRTFFNDVDTANLQLVIAAHEPKTTRVYWTYKSLSGSSNLFDKILCYDWIIDRWTTITQSGEFLTSMSVPGITLEGVDAAFGSDLDTLTIASLDAISSATTPKLAGVDSTHSFGYFTGSNLEAIMETPEQGGDGRRIRVRGFRPVSDATSVYGSISSRDTAQAVQTYGTEVSVNSVGVCPFNIDTRYARGRVRIPAAETWTYAAGIEPDVATGGKT